MYPECGQGLNSANVPASESVSARDVVNQSETDKDAARIQTRLAIVSHDPQPSPQRRAARASRVCKMLASARNDVLCRTVRPERYLARR